MRSRFATTTQLSDNMLDIHQAKRTAKMFMLLHARSANFVCRFPKRPKKESERQTDIERGIRIEIADREREREEEKVTTLMR